MSIIIEGDPKRAPRGLSRSAVNIIAKTVSRSFAYKDDPVREGEEGTYFKSDGTFKLAWRRSRYGGAGIKISMIGFCSALVGEDPQKYKLRTSRPDGHLEVLDRPEHNVLARIHPYALRFVSGALTGEYRVKAGGILVPESERIDIGDAVLTVDEYARYVMDARRGFRPPFFSENPVIIITEVGLMGRSVEVRGVYDDKDPDAVAVLFDQEIGRKRLASRILDYSLKRSKWEKEQRGRRSSLSVG